jgi:hypothetical protein
MAKKKIQPKKEVKAKKEKVTIKESKVVKEFSGYVIIQGVKYKVSKAKAEECVKRGIGVYE